MVGRVSRKSAVRGSVRALREAKLRKALLGTTALIGFAVATPAMAQSYTASNQIDLLSSINNANGQNGATINITAPITASLPMPPITAVMTIDGTISNRHEITGPAFEASGPALVTLRNLRLYGNNGAGFYVGSSALLRTEASATINGQYGVDGRSGEARIDNAGTINGVESGVHQEAGVLDLTNSGLITATNSAGVYLAGGVNGTSTITNLAGGRIQGGNSATTGYAIYSQYASPVTIINSGILTGGSAGAIRLDGGGTQTVVLNAGSVTSGAINAGGNGARKITVAGNLTGGYNASLNANSGVDTVTVAATGWINTVDLGDGDDTFIWQGGTLAGNISGGAGTDSFTSDLGAGNSATLILSRLSNFESYTHKSGELTLSDVRASGIGWKATGGSITIENILATTDSPAALELSNDAIAVMKAGSYLLSSDGYAVFSSGALTLNNQGRVGTGSWQGYYALGGTTTAIRGVDVDVTNSGSIYGAAGGIFADGTLKLVNTSTGSITGRATGSLNYDGVFALGEANIVNAGTISIDPAGYAAIYTGGGGTITNSYQGVLTGGSLGIGGTAMALYGGGTFNNYGTANSASGNGVVIVGAGARVNLFAGSTTGNITGGAGDDTLALYTGAEMSAVITDAATGITLQNSNTSAAATYGAIDLGNGTDTIELRGTRTAGFQLTKTTGVDVLTKLDTGTWSLTGAAATPGIRINAGNGAPAGTLTLAGTTGLTGDIYVNGAIVRAASAGALGTGIVHMVVPTVEFIGGANAVHANDFRLEVGSADPSVFRVSSGFEIALTGNIATGIGTGFNINGAAIDPNQAVRFESTTAGGGFVLSGTNNWNGATTIDKARVTANGGAAIGDGSTVTIQNGGTLAITSNETIGSLAGTGTVELAGKTLTLGNNDSTIFSGAITEGPIAFVGSWKVGDGPYWQGSTIYSGVEAAALLFGGNAGDYRISTNGQSVAQINDSAWMNGFGDHSTYATTPAADDLHLDVGAPGYNAYGDFSAYVSDGGAVGQQINYAFRTPTGGGLTKTGTGTLTLAGANTYTGTTTISGGTLALSGAGSVGSGAVVNNATFDVSGHTGNVTLPNLTGTGNTLLGANSLIVSNAGGTYSGNITGTGGVTKQGTGTWTLTGASNWSGTTSISGGTLVGTTSAISGSAIANNGTLNFDQAFDGSYAGNISGTGTINIVGTGLVSLAGNLTNTGPINVSGAGSQLQIEGTRSGSVMVNGTDAALTVTNTGRVDGGQNVGVRLDGAGSRVTNSGTITNVGYTGDAMASAIAVTAGTGTTYVTNNAGGVVNGFLSGINHVRLGTPASGDLVVDNSGLITSGSTGIANQNNAGALTITNNATGYIIGQGSTGNAIFVGGSEALTLTNAGFVVGTGNGVSSSASATITNSGTIASGTLANTTSGALTAGDYDAVRIKGGSITNQAGGEILGGRAIYSSADLTLSNAGTITGTSGAGVSVDGNLTITGNSGAITAGATYSAVYASGNLTLQNYAGTTTGDWGIDAGGTLNATITGGTITGTSNAIYAGGAGSTITNAGTLTGGTASIFADGVNLSVTNNGTIRSINLVSSTPDNAIHANAAGASILNNGLIEGNARAIYLAAGGTVTNNAGATILGGSIGVLTRATASASTTLINSGTIVSTSGDSTSVLNAGTITNEAGGTIVGRGWGVYTETTGINLTNSGFIGSGTLSNGTSGTFTASSGTITERGVGVAIGGGTITNNAGGTIHGGAIGIRSFEAATVVNNGTIIGTDAIWLSADADTVTLGAGSVTTGNIRLEGGNDVLNWNGGSFTNINAGFGDDTFNAALTGAATLNLASITGFEMHNLNAGDLTLAGSSSLGSGGWKIAGGNLTLGAAAQVTSIGNGVTFTGAGSLTLANDATLTATGGNGIVGSAGASVTFENAGTIRATGSNYSGVELNGGGTLTNATTGLILSTGNGVTLNATSATVNNANVIVGKGDGVVGNDVAHTLVNSGTIASGVYDVAEEVVTIGGGNGVVFYAGGSVTNQQGAHIISGGTGVSISGGAATITNGGTIVGFNVGVALNTDVGGTLINQAGGTITGGEPSPNGRSIRTGAVELGGAGTISVTLAANSTTNGDIRSSGGGTRTIDIAGTFNGSYDASNGSGVDNVTLRAGGTLVSANLGDGDDTFTYLGGTIAGIVDGGAGLNSLFADFGAGTQNSVTLANFINFGVFGVLSGNMELRGQSNTPNADIYAGVGPGTGGTITFIDTSDLTGDIYVNGGDIVANTAGAFGSGTIHLIDPKATFAATGTYANNISLEVVTPSTADPSTLATTSGVTATLTGAITQGTGAGVDPRQELVIDGQGKIILTNTANSWAGTTTINAGATLQGTSQTISGSAILANGTLAYVQPGSGTVTQNISGTGQIIVSGLATGEALTLAGTVNAAGGVSVLDGSSLINTGSIETGITLANGGSFVNAGSVRGAIITSGNATIDLLAGSGTTASIQGIGNGAATVNIAGLYTGAVSLGGGDDTLTLNSSAGIGGVSTFSGGLGNDTLAFTGTGNAGFDIGMASNFETYAMNGTGIWTLTGTDASTANWQINSGTLAVNGGGAINDASLVTIASGANLQLLSSEVIGNLAGAGNVQLGASTLQLSGTGNSSFDGTISGTGNLLIDRTTGLTLSGANTYTGQTVVLGTLTLGASDVLADASNLVIQAGGTVDLGANNDTVRIATIAGTLGGTGTLTANQYQLTGATVNANLGAGSTFNMGGSSVLNGTAAGNLFVQAGTLTLGAADRLPDTATVAVSAGATLDIGAFSDTVGALALSGTLAGSGTLTAAEYQLGGATVNGNLGTGTLFNYAGTSVLNGTAAGNVSVEAGTLALGAADRLADTATVAVASGATFDIGAFSDTIGTLGLNGTLAGTGTLTATEYQLNNATVNANLGTGTIFNVGGTSVLNGTAAANASVQAGTLALGAADRLADNATVVVTSGATFDLGAFNDTIGTLGLSGTLAGTGTLTATQYQLTNATVNANLGTGTLFSLAGTSVLNGTAAANASVQAGTLALGAADRFANNATVAVAAGATFDIGAFNDTIGTLGLSGTLAGTGTLTATEYQLTGATVNANLGTGTIFNLGGSSVLNGTAAGNVSVQAGTLRLGADDRLSDAALVGIAKDASFDLAGYNETLGGIAGAGTLVLGASKLTLAGTATSTFSGSITGNGTIEKLGAGTQILSGTLAHTGRIDVTAGTLAFGGSTQGSIRLQGGTLIGGGTLAGPLVIASGTFSPGGLSIDQAAASPIGSFTVGSLVATGGTLLFDFGGTSFNFGADSIKVNGTATLTGGTVQVNALSAAASDYRYSQLYTIIAANSLTGTFDNGSAFATVTSNPNLRWRLRYDLVPNSVVLQVQKGIEFAEGLSARDVNTLAVANALTSSTSGSASDQWSATLNAFTEAFSDMTPQRRIPTFRSLSGEILANASTATISANNQFTDLLRQRVGDGSDALIGGGFTGASLADVRTTTTSGAGFTSSLAGASLPGVDAGNGEEAGNGGIWGQVYGGYQKLIGDGVRAGLDNTVAGVAMGVETKLDGFTAGIAGGIAQIDSNMDSRNSTVSGNQYQLGGYLSYDAGSAFIAASGSWYSSDLDSKRTLSIGTTTSMATGDVHATGYSVGVSGGFRTELGKGLRLALIGSANKIRNQQDGFTESATGGLGLAVARNSRDLFTAGAELRLGAKVKTGAGVAMPWVSMGVRYNSGDLDTTGAVRFSGAPSGTGAFTVEGVKIAPVLGTLGVGFDARASKNVRLGIALEGSAGENVREGRASVRVKIGF